MASESCKLCTTPRSVLMLRLFCTCTLSVFGFAENGYSAKRYDEILCTYKCIAARNSPSHTRIGIATISNVE